MTYELNDFARMIADNDRRTAYLEAIDRHAAGARVLDLGCGSGFFTLAALHAGASHVTAVDVADAVETLPRVLQDNGLADRASVFRGDATRLDGSFDLIISDLRGASPLYRNHLGVLDHAHERLTAGGIVLPSHDRLMAVAITDETWRTSTLQSYALDDVDWSGVTDVVFAGSRRTPDLLPDEVVTTSGCWSEIDYRDRDSLKRGLLEGEPVVTATRDAEIGAIALFFEAEIDKGLRYSTGPGNRYPTYGRMRHGLREPLAIAKGDAVAIKISARRSAAEWHWEWSVEAPAGRASATSFDGRPLAAAASAAPLKPGDLRQLL